MSTWLTKKPTPQQEARLELQRLRSDIIHQKKLGSSLPDIHRQAADRIRELIAIAAQPDTNPEGLAEVEKLRQDPQIEKDLFDYSRPDLRSAAREKLRKAYQAAYPAPGRPQGEEAEDARYAFRCSR
jgi:hypothetical protein